MNANLSLTHCFSIAAYGEFLKANGEKPVTWKRAASMDEVLREADVVRKQTRSLFSSSQNPFLETWWESFSDFLFDELIVLLFML